MNNELDVLIKKYNSNICIAGVAKIQKVLSVYVFHKSDILNAVSNIETFEACSCKLLIYCQGTSVKIICLLHSKEKGLQS